MRPINKSAEPPELSAYKSTPGAEYDGPGFTPVKAAVRESLLAEQGYICAYCMKRISAAKMKIEHWHPKRYINEQLEYGNLLGCCMGNDGKPSRFQHCDKLKGDSDITYNPANPAHHPRLKIRFSGDGMIRSDDEDFDRELNTCLNLNLPRLRKNRKAVIDGVKEALGKTAGTRSPSQLTRRLRKWQRRDSEGKLSPYCQVAIYYICRKLSRCS